eukprot:Blabericola_migrator_1__11551@NODE_690_length_6863_cov_119_324897_g501_i0_p1_GENE_NODE_690_length_6863_cov_119_324897_g501_i0NODE_690_length_6863_cov_119_324897_g501_i0_p1_ORF_typecomplete_len649_score92_08_NODE_690_length_6863_cov_119_324897_g501_i01762122
MATPTSQSTSSPINVRFDALLSSSGAPRRSHDSSELDSTVLTSGNPTKARASIKALQQALTRSMTMTERGAGDFKFGTTYDFSEESVDRAPESVVSGKSGAQSGAPSGLGATLGNASQVRALSFQAASYVESEATVSLKSFSSLPQTVPLPKRTDGVDDAAVALRRFIELSKEAEAEGSEVLNQAVAELKTQDALVLKLFKLLVKKHRDMKRLQTSYNIVPMRPYSQGMPPAGHVYSNAAAYGPPSHPYSQPLNGYNPHGLVPLLATPPPMDPVAHLTTPNLSVTQLASPTSSPPFSSGLPLNHQSSSSPLPTRNTSVQSPQRYSPQASSPSVTPGSPGAPMPDYDVRFPQDGRYSTAEVWPQGLKDEFLQEVGQLKGALHMLHDEVQKFVGSTGQSVSSETSPIINTLHNPQLKSRNEKRKRRSKSTRPRDYGTEPPMVPSKLEAPMTGSRSHTASPVPPPPLAEKHHLKRDGLRSKSTIKRSPDEVNFWHSAPIESFSRRPPRQRRNSATVVVPLVNEPAASEAVPRPSRSQANMSPVRTGEVSSAWRFPRQPRPLPTNAEQEYTRARTEVEYNEDQLKEEEDDEENNEIIIIRTDDAGALIHAEGVQIGSVQLAAPAEGLVEDETPCFADNSPTDFFFSPASGAR